MIAQQHLWRSIRGYQRLCWLAIGALLCSALMQAIPHLVPTDGISIPRTTGWTAPRDYDPPSAGSANPALPTGLAPVLNATLAAHAGTDYTASPLNTPDAGLRATNDAHGFSTTFTADGLTIAPAHGTAWELHTTAIQTGTQIIPLAAAPPTAAGTRVEYRRDGLTEWYVNGPRGLEQGFTLAAPPAGAARFTIAIAVGDAALTQAGDGALNIGGLRYGDLAVVDAAGTTLPAHIETTDGEIRIAVDATGAAWPVTVDPTLSQTTLAPQTPPGNTAAGFGEAVAIAAENGTTTVVVGAPSEVVNGIQSDQGAAYVFTGSGASYTQVARLVASDGAANRRFGNAVAVAMGGGVTTIVVGGCCGTGQPVYVYTGSNGTYTDVAHLIPPDPTNNDAFGISVAVALNGGTTVIAVGSFLHSFAGSVYMFAGSGSSYPLQVELNDPDPAGGSSFGESLALTSNGSSNTLVVGAPDSPAFQGDLYPPGAVVVFEGSGAHYTATAILRAADPEHYDKFGTSVAVGIQGGVTTIAVGAPSNVNYNQQGKAYVFTGSGASYSQIKLTDANPSDTRFAERFGSSVAVGYGSPIGPTLIAVGAALKNSVSANPADGVVLFQCANSTCTQSPLPRSGGYASDGYGASMAMLTAPNGDMTLVAGTFDTTGGPGSATVYFGNEKPHLSSLFPYIGKTQTATVSAPGTFNGAPFLLAARALDPLGIPVSGVGVTFTVNAAGGAGGVFNRSDPNSTTTHVTTQASSPIGATPVLSLYPSSTAGSFTVTASVDNAFPPVTATFTLTNAARVPTPTLNPVSSAASATSTASTASGPSRAAVLPAGNGVPGVAPLIYFQAADFPMIVFTGTGFTPHSVVHYHHSAAPISNGTLSSDFTSSGRLAAELNPDVLSYIGTVDVWITNPPGPAGNDGGDSNHLQILVVAKHDAPAGSTGNALGTTSILAPYGYPVVTGGLVTNGGQPVSAPVTGTGQNLIGNDGASIIGNDGASIIGNDGASIISNDGASIISDKGYGLITNDGGGLISNDGASAPVGAAKSSGGSQSSSATQPKTSGTPQRNAVHTTTGDYTASTDANGVFLVTPFESNGIVGTHTHAITLDGIAQPITYTITNLDPKDGHPATISSLSTTTAHPGDPAFVLTVTGTGFVSGSVLSFGGVQLVTTVDSATQLHATVPAALLNYYGRLAVFVVNPDPDGGASLPVAFTIAPTTEPIPPPRPGTTIPPPPAPNPEPPPRSGGSVTGIPNPAPPPRP